MGGGGGGWTVLLGFVEAGAAKPVERKRGVGREVEAPEVKHARCSTRRRGSGFTVWERERERERD